MASPKFAGVAQYLAAQPEAARPALRRVRAALRRALPQAEETIAYQIPAYKLDGKTIIYFAGWKRHWSLYPAGARLLSAFRQELSGCEIRRSTIRFPLDAPVPSDLVIRIARFRLHEELGK